MVDPASRPEAHHPLRSPVTLANVLWVTFFLILTAATRCANYRNVFVTNATGTIRNIYFLDGDCYSRMTRVRQILAGQGMVHYHTFENWPIGLWPHTTAPMDYLIAGIALMLKPFMTDYVDMAGAIVSPILGVLTTAFIALWARELNQQYRKLMLLIVSLSPILVHGTSLGRPAHHSLQIFLLAVGLGAELIMVRTPTIRWAIISGIAWGLALWVSLYEPLVMLVLILVTKLVFYRSNLIVKERWWGLAVFLGIVAIAGALEGKYLLKSFSIEAHDQALRQYFPNWSGTIGEMSQLTVFSQLLYQWVGFGLLVSPLLLMARLRDTKRSVLLLSLLVCTFCLTLWEARWGYFFALVYAMSLPWQLSVFKRKWLVYTIYLLSLWPLAQDWESRLFPTPAQEMDRVAHLTDQVRLRRAAAFIKDHAPGGILAAWWYSPALAYWSEQPAVAGTSHESLAGIVDTCLFFSATDPKQAQEICDRRKVETVVITNPYNLVVESVHTLGQPLPDKEDTMADLLWTNPTNAPVFLHRIYDDTVVKVFEVNHGSMIR